VQTEKDIDAISARDASGRYVASVIDPAATPQDSVTVSVEDNRRNTLIFALEPLSDEMVVPPPPVLSHLHTAITGDATSPVMDACDPMTAADVGDGDGPAAAVVLAPPLESEDKFVAMYAYAAADTDEVAVDVRRSRNLEREKRGGREREGKGGDSCPVFSFL